jgi:hypothetical protein
MKTATVRNGTGQRYRPVPMQEQATVRRLYKSRTVLLHATAGRTDTKTRTAVRLRGCTRCKADLPVSVQTRLCWTCQDKAIEARARPKQQKLWT